MKMIRAITSTSLLVLGLVLGGCGDVMPRGTGGSETDACNAAAYQDLVGQDAVVALALPEPKRSYRPDEMITQDYVPTRLNIVLDDTDTITAITCG